MKLNQSGEKLDNIERHLEENYRLLTELEKCCGDRFNTARIESVKRIIKARETARDFLNGNYTDTVTVKCE